MDLSVSKEFRFTETAGIELRANAFNVLNLTNLLPFTFGASNTVINNNNFGRALGSTAGRVLELQAPHQLLKQPQTTRGRRSLRPPAFILMPLRYSQPSRHSRRRRTARSPRPPRLPRRPSTSILPRRATPFPHFWEQMFGSGRANLSLREDYRNDLRTVKGITDFKYVRFHAIFDDENGVYDEDACGNPVYNWTYVDQIYDGLLANHVRPFVELSFMPKKLSASDKVHAFWYKPLPDPPKRLEEMGGAQLPIRQAPDRSAMESTRYRNGTSRSGTSLISISGRAIRKTRPTTNSMIPQCAG